VSLRKKDPERPPRVAFGLYKRAILGMLVIILATATAGSAAVLLTVEKAVDIIKKNEGGHAIKLSHGTITAAEAGKAQTLLVLGSDHRFTDPKSAKGFSKPREARSDTIMLIHLDPHAAATTVLSIPRDLKVEIPGHGFDKINAAYSIGGPDLVVRTVKKLLGPQVKVNHVINVQFNGFQRAVNYLHGVYVDVDQFYHHSNAGLAPSQQYSEINVKPGYQKLVGSDALAYVRYRHTDSDFIRADRQQDFLRQVKDQVGESKLINELFPLLDVVSRDMQFDSTFTKKYGILDLLRLAAFSTKNPIQQVKFPNGADVNDGKAQFVVVDAAAIPGVVRSFLHPARVQKRTVEIGGGNGSSSGSSSKSSSKSKKKHKKKKKHETPSTLAPGLIKATAEMQNAAAPVIARGMVTFPFYLPSAILGGTSLASYTSPAISNPYPYKLYDRNVDKKHPHGRPHSAYRFVFAANSLQGGYYGVEGTSWRNPPIIANPTQTVMRGGRKLMYFTSGGKLRFVAWKTKHGVYWVSNTLDYELTNKQMVGIARSLTRYG
jgi:polyisoprenyl-teichoic acid--peptidoglycan teichoic acid transferase